MQAKHYLRFVGCELTVHKFVENGQSFSVKPTFSSFTQGSPLGIFMCEVALFSKFQYMEKSLKQFF